MYVQTARVVLWAGMLGIGSAAAHAQTLLDNLDQPTRAVTILGGPKADAIWAAQSFGTPQPMSLVSIDVLLGNAVDAPKVVAHLRQGEDPSGPAIAVFSMPAISDTGLEVVTLTPDTGVLLEPDVVYWLVLSPATGSFGWAYAFGNEFAGPGFFGSYAYSDDGVTWTNYGGDNPYQLRVNVWPTCAADFNADGVVNSQDVFDFLVAFFNDDPAADINFDSVVNSQDFFDFLAQFFAGC